MSITKKYQEIYGRLLSETAEIVFIKSNGKIRTMLATRNARTAEAFGFDRPYILACLDSHDKRCSIQNGNIAVTDLILGEGRSFNISRLVSINWVGEVETNDRAQQVISNFKEFDEKFEHSKLSFDDLVSIEDI